jgi:hypothetical protein
MGTRDTSLSVSECEPECLACSGEACDFCGAGCWDSSVRDCDHDVIDRHDYQGKESRRPPKNEGSR